MPALEIFQKTSAAASLCCADQGSVRTYSITYYLNHAGVLFYLPTVPTYLTLGSRMSRVALLFWRTNQNAQDQTRNPNRRSRSFFIDENTTHHRIVITPFSLFEHGWIDNQCSWESPEHASGHSRGYSCRFDHQTALVFFHCQKDGSLSSRTKRTFSVWERFGQTPGF